MPYQCRTLCLMRTTQQTRCQLRPQSLSLRRQASTCAAKVRNVIVTVSRTRTVMSMFPCCQSTGIRLTIMHRFFRCVINWACEHCWITPWPPTATPESTTLVTVTNMTRKYTDSQGLSSTHTLTPVYSPSIESHMTPSMSTASATKPAGQTPTYR